MTKVVSSTKVWIKDFSTSVFNRMTRNLLSVSFIRRNSKALAGCLLIWLLFNIGAYFIFKTNSAQFHERYIKQGLSSTQSLAAKSGPSLLEKDILALNSTIREFSRMDHLVFMAILDHENGIMAHSDPEMINKPFTGLTNKQYIDTIDGVTIVNGIYAKDKPVISFSKDITYSSIKIGKIYFALDEYYLKNTLRKYKILFVLSILLSTIAVVIALLIFDRTAIARSIRIQKEIENMDRIGPYLLRNKIGKGGMAELFLADYEREDGFRKTVAIKKVLPHLVENREFIEMFIREARLAANLQHPNIVQIMDFGKIHNAYFIAMEYVHGKNLAQLLTKHPGGGLPIELCIFIITCISSGLHYSHTKKDDKTNEPLNIVHRDISPQNMLISFQGEVKITDFGISKACSEPSLTQAGVIKGKLSYMSPEQALGKDVGPQADIYALGIVFYELLSGRKLYKFSNEIEAIRSIPTVEIEPIKNLRPDVPVEVNDIVMKCLAKDVNERYQSAIALHDDLATLKVKYGMAFGASDLTKFVKQFFREEDPATID